MKFIEISGAGMLNYYELQPLSSAASLRLLVSGLGKDLSSEWFTTDELTQRTSTVFQKNFETDRWVSEFVCAGSFQP